VYYYLLEYLSDIPGNLEFSDEDNSFIEFIYDVFVKNSIIFSSDIDGSTPSNP